MGMGVASLFGNYKSANAASCISGHICVHICWVPRSGVTGRWVLLALAALVDTAEIFPCVLTADYSLPI